MPKSVLPLLRNLVNKHGGYTVRASSTVPRSFPFHTAVQTSKRSKKMLLDISSRATWPQPLTRHNHVAPFRPTRPHSSWQLRGPTRRVSGVELPLRHGATSRASRLFLVRYLISTPLTVTSQLNCLQAPINFCESKSRSPEGKQSVKCF